MNLMPEPDVTVEGESSSTMTQIDDDTFRGGGEELQASLRKSWDEERARLEAQFSARGKLAEENTKQLETTLARKLEEKEQTIVSLEARLKEYSTATIRTERQGDEGKEKDQTTTTMRLG